jgi:hypothetical protein
VVQFSSERQEQGTIVRAGDDTVAAELATKDFDLSFEEPNAGVPTSGTRFKQEMREDVEPAKHGK